MSDTTYSFWQRNGLSVALVVLMLASIIGQILTGHQVYSQDLIEHRIAPVPKHA